MVRLKLHKKGGNSKVLIFSAGQLGEGSEQKTPGQISGHQVWAGEQCMNSLFEHSQRKSPVFTA